MRVVISEGVLEKRTALLIQNFLEQVHTLHLPVTMPGVSQIGGACCTTFGGHDSRGQACGQRCTLLVPLAPGQAQQE